MGCNHDCANCKDKDKHVKASLLKKANPGSRVKKVIAIMSGKGGVGKSMITALLASSLHKKGYKVGILDADITGPSIPKMFGVKGRALTNGESLIPSLSKGGVSIMSSNLLLEHDSDPIVWRGALIANLTTQFWTEVAWGDLDYLFVDMPPGTGDVPLTVFQSIGVDGIIVVTSPQELVSMIVSKACKMANMMDIEILGLIENMSYIECDNCHKHLEVFGESKIDKLAKEFNLDALAKVPIDPNLSKLSDKGDIEKADASYLDKALAKLEGLKVNVETVIVGIKDGLVSDKFEESTEAYAYEIVKGMVLGYHKVDIKNVNELNEFIACYNAKAVLANDIDKDLCESYENALIDVLIECKGDPLENVYKYLEMGDDCDYVNEQSCNHDCSSCTQDCASRDK